MMNDELAPVLLCSITCMSGVAGDDIFIYIGIYEFGIIYFFFDFFIVDGYNGLGHGSELGCCVASAS